MAMKKIICIGSATKDIFLPLSNVDVIDNAQDVTAQKLMAFEYGAKIYADKIIQTPGGSAVNVAVGLTKAGCRAFVFSRVSNSEIGKWILKNISKYKVKKNFMQQTGGVESEVSVVLLDTQTIEHVILRTGDSTEFFDVSKALNKFQQKVHWLYVGSQKKNWPEKMQSILEFAQQKKAQIAFNPSGYQITQDSKELVKYFPKVKILFLNRDEALEIVKNVEATVTDEPKFLLEKLKQFGANTVIITDGAKGAYAADEQGLYFLPAKIIQKVDSLGAGDAFCSGFLSVYIEEENTAEAMAFGMANSAGVIGKLGGVEGLLDSKELAKQAAELISTVTKLN